ncbi:MAG TPA: 4Fe-4S dicluster domain-containing protein [Thermoleophilaceae bacterium]|jgi:formate dehydrogenase iron-sulfur subunit|nr:4Fe-4S dicluster domain-containing protein [Thermoleophilaceae bacterium]
MATEITPGKPYGFFTDTSVCIGCKACEVACKEWNQLPEKEDELGFLGQSLDNTGELNGATWRHVQFIDNVPDETMGEGNGKAFLLMSDVCKHCKHAACLEVCPTGAIIRTEFDTVFIQEDVCNGCRDCIAACPYDVIDIDEDSDVARKCTLCYDRLQGGMEPACAKACPTDSIQFGPLDELRARAKKREKQLHAQGLKEANLYGADDDVYGGLNAFFLLMDEPEAYNLPNTANAVLPSRNNIGGYLGAAVTAVLGLVGTVIALRQRRQGGGDATETPEEARP